MKITLRLNGVDYKGELRIVKKHEPMDKERDKKLNDTIQEMCDIIDVSKNIVVGRDRTAYACEIRYAVIRALREGKEFFSLYEIGQAFGGRDHTTIKHAFEMSHIGYERGDAVLVKTYDLLKKHLQNI